MQTELLSDSSNTNGERAIPVAAVPPERAVQRLLECGEREGAGAVVPAAVVTATVPAAAPVVLVLPAEVRV